MKASSFLALAFLALGCTEEVESTDIRTSGIYPEITVTARGNGSSTVEVRLKVGGRNSNTFLDLKGEDTLEATVGDVTRTLDETSGHTYRATFPVDDGGTRFEVAFWRGEEDDSAPLSEVTLPAPFELELETREASRATDDVAFTWEPPAGGSVNWRIEGDCIFSEDGTTPDDGAAIIPREAFDAPSSDEDETCTVQLELTRSRSGSIDPAFTEGGRIVARQVRRTTLTSTP